MEILKCKYMISQEILNHKNPHLVCITILIHKLFVLFRYWTNVLDAYI